MKEKKEEKEKKRRRKEKKEKKRKKRTYKYLSSAYHGQGCVLLTLL